MLCEHANPQLIEYAAQELSADAHSAVAAHLGSCKTCQQDYEAICQWQSMANNWHDEVVPTWKPAPIAKYDWLENLRLWFPTAASTAALAMATLLFVQMPQTNNTFGLDNQPSMTYESLPPLPQATQAAMVQSVMDGSREQRQEELRTLLQILKAEMDRRSIETEESLRFVISSQLQGQQELDALYREVEGLIGKTAQNRRSTVDPRMPSNSNGAVNQ